MRRLGAVCFAISFLALVPACRDRIEGTPGARPATTPMPAWKAAPLPGDAFNVEWGAPEVPPKATAGAPVIVRVRFRNAGATVWPDVAMADPAGRTGAYAVRLGCRWRGGSTPDRDYDSSRADLPSPLPPGEWQTLTLTTKAPAEPGAYRLQIDLLQELVSWFGTRGAKPLEVPIVVEAARP